MNRELKPIYIQRLKSFAKEIMEKCYDEGYSLDEGDIHEIALKHKIIRRGFAPQWWRDEHGTDFWYTLSHWIRED